MRIPSVTGLRPLTALQNLIVGTKNKLLELTKQVAARTIPKTARKAHKQLKGRTAREVSAAGKKHRKDLRKAIDTFNKHSQ